MHVSRMSCTLSGGWPEAYPDAEIAILRAQHTEQTHICEIECKFSAMWLAFLYSIVYCFILFYVHMVGNKKLKGLIAQAA